jgi:hypothetical protein
MSSWASFALNLQPFDFVFHPLERQFAPFLADFEVLDHHVLECGAELLTLFGGRPAKLLGNLQRLAIQLVIRDEQLVHLGIILLHAAHVLHSASFGTEWTAGKAAAAQTQDRVIRTSIGSACTGTPHRRLA